MSVPIRCRRCGYKGIATGITFINSRDITIGKASETCPMCGGRADYQSGTYDFVGDAIAAFRAPGVTRASAEEFANVVSSAAKGELTTEQALQQAESINAIFSAFFRKALANGVPIDRLVNVISLILAAWAFYSSEVGGEATLGELRTQTEVQRTILQEMKKQTNAAQRTEEGSQRQAAAAERTAAESREQTRLLRELAARQDLQQRDPSQTHGAPSRAERRRAAAIERKRKKRISRGIARPR